MNTRLPFRSRSQSLSTAPRLLLLSSVVVLIGSGCGGGSTEVEGEAQPLTELADQAASNADTDDAAEVVEQANDAAQAADDAGDSVPEGAPDADASELPERFSVSCGDGTAGLCQNESDCAALETGIATEQAQACGVCLIDSDPDACWNRCLGEQVGLSPECTSCFSAVVNCTLANCAQACFQDVLAPGCVQCQMDTGCTPAFNECSGVEL